MSIDPNWGSSEVLPPSSPGEGGFGLGIEGRSGNNLNSHSDLTQKSVFGLENFCKIAGQIFIFTSALSCTPWGHVTFTPKDLFYLSCLPPVITPSWHE